MGSENFDFRFQRAMIEKAKGNGDVSRAQLEKLAIVEQYTPAARQLLSEIVEMNDVEKWDGPSHLRFRKLIDVALKSNNTLELAQVKLVFAGYLSSIGARKEAIKQLIEIVNGNPTIAFTLAMLLKSDGDLVRAKQYADIARKYYSALLEKEPSNSEARINLAKSLLVLELEQEASNNLLEGYKLTNDVKLKIAAADALVQLSNRSRDSSGGGSIELRMKTLKAALEIASESPIVIDAVTDLVLQVRKDDAVEASQLREALVKGMSADIGHFIEGTVALLENDVEKAQIHLFQAAKGNRELPGIMNNLAVAMASRPNPDLEGALVVSSAAVERLPDHPYLRETRGQILCKMKRYGDAISDLEFALSAPELAEPIHRSLAEAYDALGQTQLAEEHRKLSGSSQSSSER